MRCPKFIFISNYINHHQIPFCNEMYRLLRGDFVFLQTEPMEEERIRMGWQEVSCPYVKHYQDNPQKWQQWIAECAVVFFGGTDEEGYIQSRLAHKKPVVRYSERLYKQGQWKALSPRGLIKKYKDHTKYRRDKVYMLCAGAYVPSDFQLVRAYPGKMLRWGYFPETVSYDMQELFAQKQAGKIVWAARLIDWKHPELPLKTARYLKEQGYSFHLDMIGGGELEERVKQLVKEYELEEVVTLQGYQPPQKVRRFMEQADIYLVTSDRQEGWGAVVNEAMNSGCAVVGNHRIGAVPFLIRQGENGYIYRDGKEQELFERTAELLKDRQKCHAIGKNAYDTMQREWNAETAAARLLMLCVREGFLEQEEVILTEDTHWTEGEAGSSYRTQERTGSTHRTEGEAGSSGRTREGAGSSCLPDTGPCSPAPVISERAMYAWLQKQSKKV